MAGTSAGAKKGWATRKGKGGKKKGPGRSALKRKISEYKKSGQLPSKPKKPRKGETSHERELRGMHNDLVRQGYI